MDRRLPSMQRTSHSAVAVARPRVRASGLVLLSGGLVFLAGVSRPVVTDWAGAWESPARQLDIARGAREEFILGFVLMGLGYAVMGVGAAMMLWALAPGASARKARVEQVFGWVSLLGGLAVGGERTVQAIVDIEAAAVNQNSVLGLLGTLGLGLGFAACGLVNLSGPVWRWPSLVFAALGLLAMPTIPAVFMFAAIGYGLWVLVQFRSSAGPAGTTPEVVP